MMLKLNQSGHKALFSTIFSVILALFISSCNSSTDMDAKHEAGSMGKQAESTAGMPNELPTDKNALDKTDTNAQIAYAMGANSGQFLAKNLPEFKNWGMEFDIELIKQGFLESLEEKSQMDDSEIKTVLLAFQETIKAKLAEVEAKQAQATAEANKIFLEENAKKEGVKHTKSGIQYKIIEPGTGATPKATDKVKVNYRGTLIDGTEFDSSYSRNKPSEFILNAVIRGWTEGVQLISEGGKIELALPPELAYGDRNSTKIPANSVLLFEIELIEIMKQEKPEAVEK